MDMNDNLKNGDVSGGIGLLNSNTSPQFKKPSKSNQMNWGIKNGDGSGGNCYINIHTVSKAKNQNYID